MCRAKTVKITVAESRLVAAAGIRKMPTPARKGDLYKSSHQLAKHKHATPCSNADLQCHSREVCFSTKMSQRSP